MAEKKRHKGAGLEENVQSEPYKWNFFRLIRELERYFKEQGEPVDRTGFSYKPDGDPVRFGQIAALAFPASDIAGYKPSTKDSPAKLFVNCFGLLGCNGPMPLHFTEYIFQRIKHHDDETLIRFLDLFHHRMISLYYRAWAINQITVSKEWEIDPFSEYIGCLIHNSGQVYSKMDDIPDDARLYYSGRLIQKSMNAEGLCAILEDYFGTDSRISQFTGQWIEIPEEDRFRVGETEDTGLLGQTCILGSKIWDINQKFRIIMGPMALSLYEKIVPGTRGFSHMKAWINSYVGMTYDWEVQLILKKEEIPDFRPGRGIKLGYTSWFKKREKPSDAEDLVITGNR